MLQKRRQVRLSLSCTSRPPRWDETNGQDFIFLSREEFEEKIKAEAFLEWVEIRGCYYGTPRNPLLDDLAQGRDAVLTVDLRGAAALKKAVPEAVRVFFCPSTWAEMGALLKSRFPESGPKTAQALRAARDEMKAGSDFDYILFHENMKDSTEDLLAILQAEQWRASRGRPALSRLIDSFPG
jgi:guanylate kinase